MKNRINDNMADREKRVIPVSLGDEDITNISGVKISDLTPIVAVDDQSLFAAADATGKAFKVTQLQMREAIGANSFNSCVPTTMPTNMKDGDVYWPETIGTYTNFKDATNTPIVVAATDAVVYFIYSTNKFVKKANAVDLTNYIQKANLKNDFLAVAVKTVGLDGAISKTIKDSLDSRTMYGAYVLQTLTTEVGAINAQNGQLDPTSTFTRCINIVVTPGQKLKYTASCTQFFGIAGYDKSGAYITELDSYGLPYGNLWCNSRYAAISGTTVVTSRVVHTDIEITIPANCYLVKACSATSSTTPISPLIVSLESYGSDALSVKQQIAINSSDILTNKNQLQTGKYVAQTLTLNTGNVTANTGVLNATTGWQRCSVLSVTPGQKMRLTCSCSYTYGTSGYDKNGVFLSAVDSYGIAIGNLWSKQRWTALTGLTHPDSNTFFANVEITIPAGCYQVRASSNVTGGSPQNFPLIVELETIDVTSTTIKQQVSQNTKDIDTVKQQFISGTDITGTTYQPEAVNTTDGALRVGTTGWEHTDLITVRSASEVGKDVYIYFTGVCTGTRSDAFPPTGLAGYDTNGVFVSTLDRLGLPEGDVWDYDRFVANGFAPARTKFTGQTHCWTNVLIKLPASIYKVRGQGTVTNANVGAFPVEILKGTVINNLGLSVGGGEGSASIQSSYFSKVAASVTGWSTTPGNPNVKRFTFIHFSDIHYYDANADVNHAELNSFVNNSECADRIDAILCSGDINNGIAGGGKASAISEATGFSTEFIKSQVPVMYCPGNHDDNVNFDGSGMIGRTGVVNNAISKTELYNLTNGPVKTRYGLLQDVPNKLYSYQDFATYGIRVIAIDRYECPVISDGGANNVIRYTSTGQYGHFYSQAQLDWLQTTLASVPAGYGIVVITHGSLDNTVSDFATATCLQGWGLIPSIIDAWKKGTTYAHTYTHPTFPDMNTSKTFNFTTRGTGEFICYIGGHSHCTYYGFIPTFPTQRTIVVPCTFTGSMDTGATNKVWGMQRGANQELRNAFHIVSVDRTNKKLFLTFFGAHKDLSGNTLTDSIILPY
jgi:hypothetical protein